jgi:hypothetical protein
MKTFKISIIILISMIILPARPMASICTPDVTPAGSIQTAIDNAITGTTICIGVGTYNEQITLKDNITLQGEELSRTIIDGGATGTDVTIEDSAEIDNITITNGNVGISVETTNTVTIGNVIISNSTTGIQCTVDSTITMDNIIVDNNATGVDCSNLSDLTVRNTIISNNTTDITSDQFLNPGSDFNLLYNNPTSNYPVTDPNSIYAQDPLFVDTGLNDFHLQTGSPAIDTGTGTDPNGTQADIGAYGGANMDVTPFPIQNVTAIENPLGSDDVDVTWSANNAYNIAGYFVHYDNDNPGEPYANKPDVFNTTTTTLASLGITPAAPTGLSTKPGDRKLEISWSAVSEATGYIVSYGTSSGTYTNTVDVGNTTSTIIGSLTNNTTYYLIVSAYSQPTYYISVSTYDVESPPNESRPLNEVNVTLFQRTQGPDSVEVSDIPEKTFAFPNLDDEDRCFIATAAYGSSMEPQVILLRKFRNRYLLVNPFGKRLVAAYYSISPPIADYIRQYRWLKAIVRVLLLPFIGLAAYCLEFSPGQQYSVMLAMIASFLAMLFLFHKRKRT